MLLVVRKRDSRYEGPSSFLLEVRLQDGNRTDCSRSAFFARWRGLGILSLAPRMNACPAA
jgi:hypothetical protein